MDRGLHKARVTRMRRQVRHQARFEDLPDHAFVLWQERAHMVLGEALLPYRPAGYDAPIPRPKGSVTVLSPKPMLAVLRAGYQPVVHASAGLTAP